jgi:hypothetical protein
MYYFYIVLARCRFVLRNTFVIVPLSEASKVALLIREIVHYSCCVRALHRWYFRLARLAEVQAI